MEATADTALFILIGLAAVALAGVVAWSMWSEYHGKKDALIRTAQHRGRSVLRTPYGEWYVMSYQRLGDQVQLITQDVIGHEHRLLVERHELKVVDLFQVMCGPSNPVFEYVPGQKAKEYAQSLYSQNKDVAFMEEAREKAKRSEAKARLAETKTSEQVKELMEILAGMERSKQQPGGTKR